MSKKSYRLEIYEDVRDRIQRGEIGLDDRLVDTVIATERGVSRMPVREALMQLSHEGYLEGTSRGFALPRLTRTQILEVFELRRLLEPRAAAAATLTLTDANLKLMHEAVDRARETRVTQDILAFFRASETFRNTWVNATPNSELRQTILRYLAQVQAVRMATMRDPVVHGIIVAGQTALLSAFEARDALAAHDCMLRFVLDGERSYLDKAPEPGDGV
jgi:DNA-binding GntR family transcriptional regulator